MFYFFNSNGHRILYITPNGVRFIIGASAFLLTYVIIWKVDTVLSNRNKEKFNNESNKKNNRPKLRGGGEYEDYFIVKNVIEDCLSEPGFYDAHERQIKKIVEELKKHISVSKKSPALVSVALYIALKVFLFVRSSTQINLGELSQSTPVQEGILIVLDKLSLKWLLKIISPLLSLQTLRNAIVSAPQVAITYGVITLKTLQKYSYSSVSGSVLAAAIYGTLKNYAINQWLGMGMVMIVAGGTIFLKSYRYPFCDLFFTKLSGDIRIEKVVQTGHPAKLYQHKTDILTLNSLETNEDRVIIKVDDPKTFNYNGNIRSCSEEPFRLSFATDPNYVSQFDKHCGGKIQDPDDLLIIVRQLNLGGLGYKETILNNCLIDLRKSEDFIKTDQYFDIQASYTNHKKSYPEYTEKADEVIQEHARSVRETTKTNIKTNNNNPPKSLGSSDSPIIKLRPKAKTSIKFPLKPKPSKDRTHVPLKDRTQTLDGLKKKMQSQNANDDYSTYEVSLTGESSKSENQKVKIPSKDPLNDYYEDLE